MGVGGGQKSGIFKQGPRGYLARISAKFPKFFFEVSKTAQAIQSLIACACSSDSHHAGSFRRTKAMRGATARGIASRLDQKTN
jgi:hypothetical protein